MISNVSVSKDYSLFSCQIILKFFSLVANWRQIQQRNFVLSVYLFCVSVLENQKSRFSVLNSCQVPESLADAVSFPSPPGATGRPAGISIAKPLFVKELPSSLQHNASLHCFVLTTCGQYFMYLKSRRRKIKLDLRKSKLLSLICSSFLNWLWCSESWFFWLTNDYMKWSLSVSTSQMHVCTWMQWGMGGGSLSQTNRKGHFF